MYIWKEPDRGGDTLVSRLREVLPDALIVTPPEGVKDLSEAHLQGWDVRALVEELKAKAIPLKAAWPAPVLGADATHELAPWVRERLSGRTTREDKLMVSETIAHWLLAHGRLIVDTGQDQPQGGRPYLVADDGSLWPLEPGAKPAELVLHHVGLNASEPAFKFVLQHLSMTALDKGERRKLARFWAARGDCLYLSCGPRHLVRAEGGRLEKVPNGTDGIWFAGDATLPEWTPTDEVSPSQVAAFRPALEIPPEVPEYTPQVQGLLLEAWLVGMVSGLRPLPYLVCLGQRGGGKSTMARAIVRLFLGPEADLTTLSRDPRDLEVLLTGLRSWGSTTWMVSYPSGSPIRWLHPRRG